MAVIEILPDLFFIQRGYLNGNHFVYRSEDPVLIDTGYIAGFPDTEKLIAGLGVDLSRVRLIINTHCHCDHIGGNRAIQDRSGCEIAIHEIGKYFIDTRDAWSTWWRYYVQEAEFFSCAIGLKDGQVVSVGPYDFKVIYTPGHSADGIVLYNEQEKVLISSDILWENDVAVMTVRIEGSRAVFSLMESLDKIQSLDVKMVYPGHGNPFSDVDSALEKARKRLRQFLENPKRIGNDLIKKIIVYTLMMKQGADEESLFDYLMTTPWFVETVNLYFEGNYRPKYDDAMHSFLKRGVVKRKDGRIFTTIKP
ncbi:MAG: MBL fold metallo-hydrolase [Desulfomonile tiedjei]|uniref:MBL fold metallo-hydrolase n=1 Tax=Desulfomonile tiedjei TaxID=2358 RepID=A0A9D6YZM7_9BACT|nr:MBL fold metallo-hydrolase [Desulfomonile tiedjei]